MILVAWIPDQVRNDRRKAEVKLDRLYQIMSIKPNMCAAGRVRTFVALSGDGFTDHSDCPLRHRSSSNLGADGEIRTHDSLFTKQVL